MPTIALTPDEAEVIGAYATYDASSALEGMGETDDPVEFLRGIAELDPHVAFLGEIASGVVTDLGRLRVVARYAQKDAAVGVVGDRRSLERLRGGDMDYCHCGHSKDDSERLHVKEIARHEKEANSAADVLDRLRTTLAGVA